MRECDRARIARQVGPPGRVGRGGVGRGGVGRPLEGVAG